MNPLKNLAYHRFNPNDLTNLTVRGSKQSHLSVRLIEIPLT